MIEGGQVNFYAVLEMSSSGQLPFLGSLGNRVAGLSHLLFADDSLFGRQSQECCDTRPSGWHALFQETTIIHNWTETR